MHGRVYFTLLHVPDEALVRRRTAYFQRINGKPTDYAFITSKNRTRSVNQFLTHWIYPYKGKFHPQMIRALLNIIGVRAGETVLDLFVGSTTAALEAHLLGINFVGFDISPLCVLQSRVKVESRAVLDEIETAKNAVLSSVKAAPLRIASVNSLSAAIEQVPKEQARNFYKLADLLAHSDVARRKREFAPSFMRAVQMMLASVRDHAEVVKALDLQPSKVHIRQCDARNLPLRNESVDGIITSPPVFDRS